MGRVDGSSGPLDIRAAQAEWGLGVPGIHGMSVTPGGFRTQVSGLMYQLSMRVHL